VNLVFLRQASPGSWALGLGLAGMLFGVVWGRTTKLRVTQGSTVEAERSILYLILWGVSFAVTQVLAAFADARWVAGGLAAMFFATGVALGSNLDLLWRFWRVGHRGARPITVDSRAADRA
jgi:hypothetical protein